MAEIKKQVPRAEWPEIIGPKDLQELTGGIIGRRMAYDLFAEEGFPMISIGNKWLVRSDDFWSWWDSHKGKTVLSNHPDPAEQANIRSAKARLAEEIDD